MQGTEMTANLQGFTRSADSWQDETNADKFGNIDAVAQSYRNAGLSNITFPVNENKFNQSSYDSTVFLEVQKDSYGMGWAEFRDYKKSFELKDSVKSTG